MTIVVAGCTGAWLVGPVSKMPETEESESIDMDPAVPPFMVVAGAAVWIDPSVLSAQALVEPLVGLLRQSGCERGLETPVGQYVGCASR